MISAAGIAWVRDRNNLLEDAGVVDNEATVDLLASALGTSLAPLLADSHLARQGWMASSARHEARVQDVDGRGGSQPLRSRLDLAIQQERQPLARRHPLLLP